MTPIGEDDLEAYIDGRLGEDRRAALEAYLAGNPELAARLERDRHLRAGIRAALQAKADEPLPPHLRIQAIRATLRQRRLRQLRLAAAFAGIMLTGAAGGWWLRGSLDGSPGAIQSAGGMAFSRDALAAYRTFVVEKRHPVEVDAAQEAHLVAWLSKRLGRQLLAPALDGFGFRLMGGRLLPVSEGDTAAAQFMYESEDGRRMTLYVRAGPAFEGIGTETAFRFQQAGDAATFAWIDRGSGFAITAPGARSELLPIAEAVYRAYETATAP